MARDTTTLSLDELSFRELKQEHLLAHAKSLGGKKAVEAVKYLMEINKRIPPTQEDIDKKRDEMKKKMKQKKQPCKDKKGNIAKDEEDNIIYELVETKSRLYSDAAIEKVLSEYKGELVNTPFKQKQLYCEKYWKSKLPKKKAKETTFDEELAAALAELEEA